MLVVEIPGKCMASSYLLWDFISLCAAREEHTTMPALRIELRLASKILSSSLAIGLDHAVTQSDLTILQPLGRNCLISDKLALFPIEKRASRIYRNL